MLGPVRRKGKSGDREMMEQCGGSGEKRRNRGEDGERGWKKRGVKWPSISQALRTRDRDVLREEDKNPLSRLGPWVGIHPLSPSTFFYALASTFAGIVNTYPENGFHYFVELHVMPEITDNYSAQSIHRSGRRG
ncbi:hypothetical protein KM043_012467 [Ampulex compressa]|nr:hypothetical protein KM043_012467 [Ampulex compressa]